MSKPNPFDFVRSINQKVPPPPTMDGYSQYLVNHALYPFLDTIFLVEYLNSMPELSDKMHFDFLYHTVTPRKRWDAWLKKEKVENLELVKEAYGYSNRKAQQALQVLTDADLESLRKSLDKGG